MRLLHAAPGRPVGKVGEVGVQVEVGGLVVEVRPDLRRREAVLLLDGGAPLGGNSMR